MPAFAGMLLLAADLAAQNGAIENAPAFSGGDLTALPSGDWITNGGNVFNQRYSPLTAINLGNVGELKALWRTGMGTGGASQVFQMWPTVYPIPFHYENRAVE